VPTTLRALRRAGSPAAFIAVLTAVYATAFCLRGVLDTIESPQVLAAALVLDMAVLVPVAYYVLVVRRFGWPVVSVAGVFVLSLIAATRVIPHDYRSVLTPVEVVAALTEVAIIGFILWKVAGGARRYRAALAGEAGDDTLATIRGAARRVIDSPRVADILAFEMALIYYGLLSWRRSPVEGPGRYPAYRTTGYGAVLLGIGVMLAAELIAVHVIVHLYWSTVGAWILSLLSAYAGVWLLAEWQVHRLRPISLDADALRLRSGLRWEVEVAYDNITSMGRVSALEDKPRGTLDLVPFGDALFEVTTDAPVVACGPYGIRRSTTRIRFTVDDPSGFEDALSRHLI
jgi:hypothetical protein